ncbi:MULTISPECIES: hypothetical protein [Streptomyces]|nr:hypothetical protein [Streptomyces sp. WAC04657]
MHVSPRTAEQHIARAMQKTGTASRTDLVDTDDNPHRRSLHSAGE